MKITDVKVIKLGVQLPKPLRLSKGREFNSRGAALVIIETDEGIQGIGEGYGPESYIVKTIIEQKFKPWLIGQDPLDIERLWRRMLTDPVYWDQKGQGVSAASGVDMALWALQGFQAVKTHLGRGLKEDEKRVKAIRDAIGDVDLMIDMNCGYNRVDAFKVGKMLEKYDIYWYEEPLSPYDIAGLVYLKNKLDIPIATGENEYTKWGFKELFLKNAVDFAMPDIMRCGGITETKKICALAEAFDVICTLHNYTTGVGLAATLQVMACTPNCEWLEFDVTDYALYDALLKNPLEIDGKGMVKIPTDPGLGVELKDNLVDKYMIP